MVLISRTNSVLESGSGSPNSINNGISRDSLSVDFPNGGSRGYEYRYRRFTLHGTLHSTPHSTSHELALRLGHVTHCLVLPCCLVDLVCCLVNLALLPYGAARHNSASVWLALMSRVRDVRNGERICMLSCREYPVSHHSWYAVRLGSWT